MALFLLDEAQFNALRSDLQSLTTAVNSLSDNVTKWQGAQTTAIQAGLAELTAAVTGVDVKEVQQKIDAVASNINLTAEEQQEALDKFNQPKEN